MLATNKIRKMDVIENCREILSGFDRQFEILRELAAQDDENSKVLYTYKSGEVGATVTVLFNLGLIRHEEAEKLHGVLAKIEKDWRDKACRAVN